jgi:hypothetical protein
VVVLPQAAGLCGLVPDRPALQLEAQPGDLFPLVNSLGSCLSSACNPEQRSERPRADALGLGFTARALKPCRR